VRRRAAILTLSLAGILGGPPAADAGAAKHTCNPAHSTTIAATATVRVFRTRAFSRETKVHATYGCLLHRKVPVRFLVPDFPTGYDHITIAGRFVAYADYSDCAAGYCDPNNVIVQDLRNGKTSFADGPMQVAEVTGVVLRPTGSAAWIASSFDDNGSLQPALQVVKAEYGRPPVVLDPGPGVGRDSLALAGSALYWMRGTTPVAAILG
jgi:hypothetical protein